MYTVLIPDINPEGTYYLCNGYGGVATVKGSDIKIQGHFVTDGDKTEFEAECTYDNGDTYSIENVKVKHGMLLTRAPLKCIELCLSWYNRASNEHVAVGVMEDLTLSGCGVWICKDYEPRLVVKATDDALILPYNDYIYDSNDGRFHCEIDSGLFANDQVYRYAEDVRFYCRCHAVTDKSMAQHVRLTDEQLAEVNARVKNLMDYCDEQGIALVYDNDDGVVRAYKSKDLPEGYEAYINDSDNGNPQSMTVPWSGLRKVDGLDLGYVNPDWQVYLDYTEPKKEAE